jgi:hypothetical protein
MAIKAHNVQVQHLQLLKPLQGVNAAHVQVNWQSSAEFSGKVPFKPPRCLQQQRSQAECKPP